MVKSRTAHMYLLQGNQQLCRGARQVKVVCMLAKSQGSMPSVCSSTGQTTQQSNHSLGWCDPDSAACCSPKCLPAWFQALQLQCSDAAIMMQRFTPCTQAYMINKNCVLIIYAATQPYSCKANEPRRVYIAVLGISKGQSCCLPPRGQQQRGGWGEAGVGSRLGTCCLARLGEKTGHPGLGLGCQSGGLSCWHACAPALGGSRGC